MRKISWLAVLLAFAVPATAQAPGTAAIPDWALPDSPTHRQVAPPLDFHRDAVTANRPIGLFENQSDVGGPLVPGETSYDAASRSYTITSAGYNIWYTRDEFRFLWKKLTGNVSLSASIDWPKEDGFGDRKAVLIIRAGLNDDAEEVLVGEHGAAMVQFARRAQRNTRITDMEYQVASRGGLPGGSSPDALVKLQPARVGLEKKGDSFQFWVSWQGEPIQKLGAPIILHLDGPFYAGIGFASHLPTTVATVRVRDVVLENRAGRIR
jgi:hypothetical protein